MSQNKQLTFTIIYQLGPVTSDIAHKPSRLRMPTVYGGPLCVLHEVTLETALVVSVCG